MKPFLYFIGGLLMLGALLIVARAQNDAWIIAALLTLAGIAICCRNRD